MASHLTTLYGCSILSQSSVPDRIEEESLCPDHIRDQKGTQRRTRLPKHKIDDGTSSKTHLVRLMHNVVSSKLESSSVQRRK